MVGTVTVPVVVVKLVDGKGVFTKTTTSAIVEPLSPTVVVVNVVVVSAVTESVVVLYIVDKGGV